ncbi:MAG: hypothetical protein ABFS46_09880 [Myxococcota bacterium]
MLPHARRRRPRRILALLLLPALSSCFAYSNVERDVDDHPVVNTGARATILYPGQAPPPLSSSPQDAGLGDGAVLLGGASVDEVRHEEYRQEPLWLKPLLLPFAVVAWPFKKVGELVRSDPPPPLAPVAPTAARTPEPSDAQATWEASQLEQMRRELAKRQGSSAPGGTATAPSPAPLSGSAGRSIADELAALRARRGGPSPMSAPAIPVEAPPRADRALDRNGDGRPDHWLHGPSGSPEREVFDDAGDGTPNRWLFYESGSDALARVEEDLDGDGAADSWETYQDGRPLRRRADTNGSGSVDTWTFFRDGVPLRHEQDTDGDGFRDRIGYYEAGRLAREEEDLDDNGQPDRVSHFDEAGNLARRDEDSDGDGVVDLSSFYEGGRLVRRELLSEAALRALGESLNPMPAFDEGGREDG